MKIHENLQQRSLEWGQMKLGKISGSRIYPIISSYTEPQYYVDNPANRKKGIVGELKNTPGFGDGAVTYALELLTEELLQESLPVFVTDAMMHGIEYEPYAREIYEKSTNIKVVEVGGIEEAGMWYSPDGLVGDDGIIEIKCPQPLAHMRFLVTGEIKPEYIAQMQFGMYVSGREWCDFISFSPDFPDEYKAKCVRVEKDVEYIAAMERNIVEFLELKASLKAKLLNK